MQHNNVVQQKAARRLAIAKAEMKSSMFSAMMEFDWETVLKAVDAGCPVVDEGPIVRETLLTLGRFGIDVRLQGLLSRCSLLTGTGSHRHDVRCHAGCVRDVRLSEAAVRRAVPCTQRPLDEVPSRAE